MKTLDLKVAFDKEYVTIRYCAEEKYIWNEWRGLIPSQELRDAILFACYFILDNDVELILADFSKMTGPSLEDQVWIANHSADLLKHSKLKRVANVLAPDLFQQVAIENIYDIASEVPMPCITKDFVSKEEALHWLFPS